jgi:8-oxo-dGTP pyrophosphatase MutT (NUDIX family)
VTTKPWRNGVRALVLDPFDRVLLVHFSFPPYPWAPPGGGIDPGESDEHALRRELAEELGLDEFELGPCLWTREHEFDRPVRFRGQRERCYLIRVDPFEPVPRLDLAAEYVTDVRWWTPAELERSTEVFGPRMLPVLVEDLLENGPPLEPPALGV